VVDQGAEMGGVRAAAIDWRHAVGAQQPVFERDHLEVAGADHLDLARVIGQHQYAIQVGNVVGQNQHRATRRDVLLPVDLGAGHQVMEGMRQTMQDAAAKP